MKNSDKLMKSTMPQKMATGKLPKGNGKAQGSDTAAIDMKKGGSVKMKTSMQRKSGCC